MAERVEAHQSRALSVVASLTVRVMNADDRFRIAERELGLFQLKPEILGFLAFAAEMEPQVACEVGTWRCGTTYLLAHLIPSLSLLIGVDRQLQNEEKLRELAPPRVRLELVEGGSTDNETLKRVGAILGSRELDILFIDAGHRYEAVTADFLAYRGFVREGGLIALHDVISDYRTRFGATNGPWGGDVPQAWKRVRAAYRSREFVDDPEQNGYGIGVVTYSAPAPAPDF
jgi:predicted O-methyltransferase YrrM